MNRLVRLSRTFFYSAIAPAFLILLALVIYPTYKVLTYSLMEYKLTKPNASSFVWFHQYAEAFADERFRWALGRSLYFALLSVLLTLVIGYAIAELLRRDDLKGMCFFRSVILVPMLITPLVVGAVFRYMYDYDYGVVNDIIRRIGLQKIPFLGDPFWALHAAVLADVWQWTPFAAIVLLAGLEAMPREPLEAAALDGAGFWQTLWSIKMPLLRPVIGVTVLLRFMDAFREFDKLYILTAGGPGTSSETLSIYVWRQAFQYFNTGYGAAMGVVMLFVINILSTFYVKLSKTLQ
ncbi:MAG: sugar ABC transporter permease [Limnochordaceae bacterium]|nr:sugar ABC transporter permease [Limnochordaceae bacterium]